MPITSPRNSWLLSGALLLLFQTTGSAGQMEIVENTSSFEPWVFKLGAPGWIAGVWGEVGVYGTAVHVDVPASTILSHLNFTAALNVEARKGRFGAYADYLYLNAQSGTPTPGLVSRVDLHVAETLTDFDVSWRFLESSRGWLDLLIGVRYTNLYSKLGLNPDNSAIEKASREFVNAAANQVESLLDQALHGVLEGENPKLPVPPLANQLEDELLEAILEAKQSHELVAAIASGDKARIAAAKKNVEKKIARLLKRQLSRSFSLNEWWFDPYLGIRARYNLTSALYLTGKATVGGFSVGSQITWEGYGALGWQISRCLYSEVGYRYLYVNYRRNGFIYDTSTGGAQVTVGLVF